MERRHGIQENGFHLPVLINNFNLSLVARSITPEACELAEKVNNFQKDGESMNLGRSVTQAIPNVMINESTFGKSRVPSVMVDS